MIIEAEKPHYMPSASWRPKEGSSHLSPKPENQGNEWFKSQFKARRRQRSQLNQSGTENKFSKSNFPFPCLFVLSRPQQVRGCPFIWGKQSALFSPLIHMLISSSNTLTDISKNNLQSIIWHSMTQSSLHIKLMITMGPFWRQIRGENANVSVCEIYLKRQIFKKTEYWPRSTGFKDEKWLQRWTEYRIT